MHPAVRDNSQAGREREGSEAGQGRPVHERWWRGTDAEEKVRTSKGPAAEDRGCAWAGSRSVSLGQGRTGREAQERISVSERRFFHCKAGASTLG